MSRFRSFGGVGGLLAPLTFSTIADTYHPFSPFSAIPRASLYVEFWSYLRHGWSRLLLTCEFCSARLGRPLIRAAITRARILCRRVSCGHLRLHHLVHSLDGFHLQQIQTALQDRSSILEQQIGICKIPQRPVSAIPWNDYCRDVLHILQQTWSFFGTGCRLFYAFLSSVAFNSLRHIQNSIYQEYLTYG
jgi:hypothetical protein